MSRNVFSAEEYVNMVMVYAECNYNGERALRVYAERFPNARRPRNARVIWSAISRLRNNEPVVPRSGGGPRPTITVHQEESVIRHFEEEPQSSTRRAGRLFHMSHTSVHKILKKNKMHPYSYQKVQALLSPTDYERRLTYCQWALERCAENPRFTGNVIWSDESLFSRNGMWNRRICHHWAEKGHNPHATRPLAHQIRWSVNVWAGIRGNDIIGPVFIPGTLNRARYLALLNDTVERYIDGLPLAEHVNVWFQHDGAPPHISAEVRSRLDVLFDNRWIGRYGPHAWPPRSPDLTPLDFFFWGWVKQLVYKKESHSQDELKMRICAAFRFIKNRAREDSLLMQRVHSNTQRRLQRCVERRGQHIEQLNI